MKKLLIVSLLSAWLEAGSYISIGGSKSDISDTLLDCRASAIIGVGYDINDYVAVEARGAHGMGGGYEAYSAYFKPKYKHFYGLIGVKHQEINDISYDNITTGIGFGYNGISFDIEYANENVFATLLYTYRF